MAGLLAELTEESQSRRPGGRCSVRIMLASLPDADRAEWQEALDNEIVTSRALADVARRRLGVTISAQSFARHRRGECVSCLA